MSAAVVTHGPCEECGQARRHRPLCSVNLEAIDAQAAELVAWSEKLAERHRWLRADIAEVRQERARQMGELSHTRTGRIPRIEEEEPPVKVIGGLAQQRMDPETEAMPPLSPQQIDEVTRAFPVVGKDGKQP